MPAGAFAYMHASVKKDNIPAVLLVVTPAHWGFLSLPYCQDSNKIINNSVTVIKWEKNCSLIRQLFKFIVMKRRYLPVISYKDEEILQW